MSVLSDAADLVSGARQDLYGHPAEDFARTAALWRALFGWDVKPEDVALAMACVKLSRLRATPGHEDSVVDLAGYAQCYWTARTGHS
jgi:hypothetical protein